MPYFNLEEHRKALNYAYLAAVLDQTGEFDTNITVYADESTINHLTDMYGGVAEGEVWTAEEDIVKMALLDDILPYMKVRRSEAMALRSTLTSKPLIELTPHL